MVFQHQAYGYREQLMWDMSSKRNFTYMMTKCNRKYESRKIIRYRQLIQKKIEALLACIINELTLPARQASVVEGTLIIRLDTGRSCA